MNFSQRNDRVYLPRPPGSSSTLDPSEQHGAAAAGAGGRARRGGPPPAARPPPRRPRLVPPRLRPRLPTPLPRVPPRPATAFCTRRTNLWDMFVLDARHGRVLCVKGVTRDPSSFLCAPNMATPSSRPTHPMLLPGVNQSSRVKTTSLHPRWAVRLWGTLSTLGFRCEGKLSSTIWNCVKCL